MVNVQRFNELQDLEDGHHLNSKTMMYDSPGCTISAVDKITRKKDYDVSRIVITVSRNGKSERAANVYRSTRRFAKEKCPFCDISIVTKDDQDKTKAIVLSYLAKAIPESAMIEYLYK